MRDDLAALTPDALSSLSSIGLLKRAQRMMATGLGPRSIEEDDDGIVTATFDDGTTTSLPPKATLAQARCSCGAVFVCRHGLSLVLAYQKQQGGGVAELDDWEPGEVTDKEVIKLIGSLGRARANRLMRGGIVVHLSHDPHPTARLPTCTLQFLVPNDLTHARCDCELGTACEHLLIAVRAFRQAQGQQQATVELAGTEELDLAATRDATELAREVLWHGLSHAPEALDARFERIRTKLNADGQVWPVAVLNDLHDALHWYRARSARYSPALAAAAAELEARCRAVLHDKPRIPVSMVLGTAVAAETKLADLRLTSLGARVRTSGAMSTADIYLVDSDTGNVLVLRTHQRGVTRRHQKTPATAPTGPEMAARQVVKNVRLGDLATGQLLTQTARRRPNRELVLSWKSGTQVVRAPGDWSALGAPIVISKLSELIERNAKRPPSILRPRVLAENLHVMQIQEVRSVLWSPGEQSLVGEVVLVSGESVRIERQHRSAAPNAIAVLAKALQEGPQWMSGEVRQTEFGVIVSPTALRTDSTFIVPDLEPDAATEIELGAVGSPSSPIGAALDDAVVQLDEGAHSGLAAATQAWCDRTDLAASRLEGLGLKRVADSIRAATASAKKARVGGRKAAPEAPTRWLDARITLVLAREMLLSQAGAV